MSDAPQPSITDVEIQQPTAPSAFGSYLAGARPLWKAFWFVFVLGNLTVAIATETIVKIAGAISTSPAPAILFNPYHLAYLKTSVVGLYFVYSAIVLWRCTSTTPSYGMRYGVRTFLVLYSLWWLYGLVSFLAFVIVRLYG